MRGPVPCSSKWRRWLTVRQFELYSEIDRIELQTPIGLTTILADRASTDPDGRIEFQNRRKIKSKSSFCFTVGQCKAVECNAQGTMLKLFISKYGNPLAGICSFLHTYHCAWSSLRVIDRFQYLQHAGCRRKGNKRIGLF